MISDKCSFSHLISLSQSLLPAAKIVMIILMIAVMITMTIMIMTRSLEALRTPTYGWLTFRPLDIVPLTPMDLQ